MKKIPNVFMYDKERRGVSNIVNPGCEWVLNGLGVATEKLDGTNVRVTIRSGELMRIEKRKNPTKKQKERGIFAPWYVDASTDNNSDKWIIKACESPWFRFEKWPDGEYNCEAVGPKINNNRTGLSQHYIYPFNLFPLVICNNKEIRKWNEFNNGRSFSSIKKAVLSLKSSLNNLADAEGIVFHYKNKRAKIRRKDFDEWND